MKYFLARMSIFIIPLFLLFFIPVFTLIIGRETLKPSDMFSKQYNNNELVGTAYSYHIKPYKLEGIKRIKPSLLIAGSSRVMQVRSFFFKNGNIVYNSGGFIGTILDADCLLNNLPAGYHPDVLLLGLDQYFFNANVDAVNTQVNCDIQDESSGFYSLLKHNFKRIYTAYASGKILPQKLINGRGIGLNALMNNEGFRPDGSYRYGKLLTDPAGDDDYGFKDTYKRINHGSGRFEYGKDVNDGAIQALDKFLAKCKRRNIHILDFCHLTRTLLLTAC